MPGMQYDELSDRVVLRAMRSRARRAVIQTRNPGRCPGFRLCIGRGLLRGLRETALVSRGGVPMNKPFARSTIEQANSFATGLDRGLRIAGFLQGRAERRALRTVAHRGGARLPHVLLGGLDIRQEKTLRKSDEAVRFWRRKAKDNRSRMSRRHMALT